jgi:hypothetical protein
MKLLRRTAFSLLFAAIMASATQHHAFAADPDSALKSGVDRNFNEGTNAMNDQRWADAIHFFDEVIKANTSRTDAALYWKAYNLRKIGRGNEAKATCEILHARFGSSTWNNDCTAMLLNGDGNTNANINSDGTVNVAVPVPSKSALRAQVDAAMATANVRLADINREMWLANERGPFKGEPRNPEDDLKLLALNSLMQQDPARGLPLLRDILAGNGSTDLKKHALFILTQSKAPEAQSILDDVVKGKMGPELQRQAIPTVAVLKGGRANDTFAEIYKTSTDERVKRSVISAFFITHDAPHLVDIARNEKDLKLKRDIVSQLALMHDKVAQDYMLELLK